MAFSPDANLLLVGSGYELLLWDVPATRILRQLKVPDQFRHFTECEFSSDGKTVYAATAEGTIAIWNTDTGKLQKTLPSEDWMYDCDFSAARDKVLSIYQSGKVTMRELPEGKLIWQIKTPTFTEMEVCELSKDGKSALVAAESGSVILDAATGKTLKVLLQADATSHGAAALSPDGRLVAAKEYDPEVRSSGMIIVDVGSGKTLHRCQSHTNEVLHIKFSPDGSLISTTSSDNTLKLWNSATGQLVRTYSGHAHDVTCAAFTPDGSKIMTGSQDLSLKLWDCRREEIPEAEYAQMTAKQAALEKEDMARGYAKPLVQIFPTGYKFGIEDAALSADGRKIIACRNGEPVLVYDADTGKELLALKHEIEKSDQSAFACSFSKDGKFAISAGRDGKIHSWYAATGKLMRTFNGHSSYVKGAALSPNSVTLLSAGYDRAASMWSPKKGTTPLKIEGFVGELEGAQFFPDGKTMAIVPGDQTVRILRSSDGSLVRTIETGFHVQCIAISPNGKTLFAGSAREKKQGLWDVATGKPTPLPSTGRGYTHSASFSPDGKWLATGALAPEICVREATSGKLKGIVRSRYGHSDSITAVSFSDDGRKLLTGSDDGSLKIWDFIKLLESLVP